MAKEKKKQHSTGLDAHGADSLPHVRGTERTHTRKMPSDEGKTRKMPPDEGKISPKDLISIQFRRGNRIHNP